MLSNRQGDKMFASYEGGDIMKIRLPIMIQDPKLSGYPHLKRIVERPYVD